VWTADGENKSDNMFSRFYKTPASDGRSDRQTDGQTSFDSIVRAMYSIAQYKLVISHRHIAEQQRRD